MCRFGDNNDSKILKIPYDYEVSLSNDDIRSFDVEQAVKHFSSIDLAKKYHQTHKIGQILNSFLAKYYEILEQYEEAINNYSISDFEEILKREDD